MGTQSVRWAVKVGVSLALTPTNRSILVYLAHRHNGNTGQCNPDRATIVAETGWNDRSVRRALADFAEKGLVTASEDGSGYVLHLDSQSNSLDSQSEGFGLTVQGLDSQSKSLDSQSSTPYIRKEHPTEHPENTPLVIVSEPFDEFWTVWPKKVDKPAAKRAWTKAIKRIDPQTIIAAATAYRANPGIPDRQFIPHPATWLNGDRWNDELPRLAAHQPQRRPTRTEQNMSVVARIAAQEELELKELTS